MVHQRSQLGCIIRQAVLGCQLESPVICKGEQLLPDLLGFPAEDVDCDIAKALQSSENLKLSCFC